MNFRNTAEPIFIAMRELKLLSTGEISGAMSLFEATFPFRDQVENADTIHLHVKVESTDALPHAAILALGGRTESEQSGYIKYTFAGGVNVIFSSIPVAEEDRLVTGAHPSKPFLDHAGVDLRREIAEVRTSFDAVPAAARDLGWRHVAQGGADRAVFCCHTQVNEKHWIYPPLGAHAWNRPLEFAYGPLVVHASSMGCDLRPIDPADARAAEVGCCATASCAPPATDSAAKSDSYYDPKDMLRFGDVGRYASETMDKFWVYFDAATAQPGALSAREKALIALAVAHAKQCPYCIDSFTSKCLDVGANAEQMHEAVHVAAAMAAGIDLVHAVQMQNTLRAKGAIV
ncbi:MAG: arsenosugar biosynthesis-associated peroxidase-like protein [Tahibacter sp.]